MTKLMKCKQVLDLELGHKTKVSISKAFDMVSDNVFWSVVASMGYPAHIIHLIKQLRGPQKAAVRTSHGLTCWFKIEQGVRQGSMLSLHLLNIYSEQTIRNALDGLLVASRSVVELFLI